LFWQELAWAERILDSKKNKGAKKGIAQKWCKPHHRIEIWRVSRRIPLLSTGFSTFLWES
jgi:hypothetical protein